ncbi:hypothetical protein VTJ04DRAFT_1644 [Mycothermus thermophilus]|uniref:uncharacterized protein n=1 Tax=Humicola insolens TaxID=85995 RepID=UPI003742F2BC
MREAASRILSGSSFPFPFSFPHNRDFNNHNHNQVVDKCRPTNSFEGFSLSSIHLVVVQSSVVWCLWTTILNFQKVCASSSLPIPAP